MIGDHFAYISGFVHGLPLNSHSGNQSSSVAPYILVRLNTPACETSAANWKRGSVLCPRIQLTIYPPYAPPAAPIRALSTYPCEITWAVPFMMSVKAFPPQSAETSLVNCCP